MTYEYIITSPALYTSPPSSVTRSALLFLILAMQSTVELPLTQPGVTSKVRFCAVMLTYFMNSMHLVHSPSDKVHHLKLIDAEMFSFKTSFNF